MKHVLIAEEAWAVCGPHPDDGYPCEFSYWTNEARANKEAERLRKSGQTEVDTKWCQLYYESSGQGAKHYYRIQKMNAVYVDPPSRDEVKAKLTDAELAVLGLKR